MFDVWCLLTPSCPCCQYPPVLGSCPDPIHVMNTPCLMWVKQSHLYHPPNRQILWCKHGWFILDLTPFNYSRSFSLRFHVHPHVFPVLGVCSVPWGRNWSGSRKSSPLFSARPCSWGATEMPWDVILAGLCSCDLVGNLNTFDPLIISHMAVENLL